MKKIKKIIVNTFYILVVLLIVLIIASHFIDFGHSQAYVSKKFEEISQAYTLDTIQFENREVAYIHAGDTTLPLLVFVHGSPANWTSWLSYLTNEDILAKYQVLAFNRLGYEDNTNRSPEPDLGKQALVIEGLMQQIGYVGKMILLGHSYGAPVIVKYAILFPERVNKLILMGASIDPDLEPDKWYFKAASKKSLRWILPEMFDVSNREIVPLRGELKKMKSELGKIHSEIFVLHGYKDKLVPFENVDYIRKEFVNAKLTISVKKNSGHLFVFTHSKETIQEILGFIE